MGRKVFALDCSWNLLFASILSEDNSLKNQVFSYHFTVAAGPNILFTASWWHNTQITETCLAMRHTHTPCFTHQHISISYISIKLIFSEIRCISFSVHKIIQGKGPGSWGDLNSHLKWVQGEVIWLQRNLTHPVLLLNAIVPVRGH